MLLSHRYNFGTCGDRISATFLFATISWHVSWKMRLEMVKETQIEILNGGEIVVNCKFKLNKNLNLKPRNTNPIRM